ncbi:MAG TPA: TIGR02996 domain-containing protein [Kofleriaceae bacterium]|nr:TIGR02996 domain-containing protein [Kofleriaceae bacterium]
MSRADDDPLNFDSTPTGRLGIAGEAGRGRRSGRGLADGTPRPIQGVLDDLDLDDDVPTPVSPDEQDTGLLLDTPTAEHTAVEVGPARDDEPLRGDWPIAEDAPLDRDATERELLAAIASGDETSRAVYADWLEERSEHARAGFLRIEQLVARLGPGDPRFDACTRQLRELMQHIDPAWRARVARPPIEGCPSFAFRCPQRWDALARTEREDVRHCGTCRKHVHYFDRVDDARAAARAGHCVAIDLGSERWEDDLVDLGTRCASCARRVVSSAQFCPHCGEPFHTRPRLTLGMLAMPDDDDDDDEPDGSRG